MFWTYLPCFHVEKGLYLENFQLSQISLDQWMHSSVVQGTPRRIGIKYEITMWNQIRVQMFLTFIWFIFSHSIKQSLFAVVA